MVVKKDGCFWKDLNLPMIFKCEWPTTSNLNGSLSFYALFLQAGHTIKDLDQFSYHQSGQRITPSNFVWMSRIDKSWPTSVEIKYLARKKKYIWKITRLGRGTDGPNSSFLTRDELKLELVEFLNLSLPKYYSRLRDLVERDKREFAIGDDVALVSSYGGKKVGQKARILEIGSNNHLLVRFLDRDQTFNIDEAFFDYVSTAS